MQIPGFTPYVPRVRKHRSIITCSQGRPKCGKSNFALTKPSPHAYIDLDEAVDELMPKFANKQLHVCSTKRPDGKNQQDFVRCYTQLEQAYNDALKIPGLRSLTIDQGTDWWEIMRMARFGKLAQVPPLKYTEVNSEFTSLVKSAKDYDLNVTWIHRTKSEYKANEKTGHYTRSGFGDLEYIADVVIEHDRVTEKDEEGNPVTQFSIRVLDCRQNPDVIGLELVGNDVSTFPTLAGCVYPTSTPEDWE